MTFMGTADATPVEERNGRRRAALCASSSPTTTRCSARASRRCSSDAGHDVVGRAVDADDLLLKVRSYTPDIAIVDVRMPPGNADDGLVAAAEIRRTYPSVTVLVLSQHLEPTYMLELVGDDASGVGYLLKDRVRDVDRVRRRRRARGGRRHGVRPGGREDARRRAPPLDARRADRPRARRAVADRRGTLEPRDRQAASSSARARSSGTSRGSSRSSASPTREDDNRRVLAVLALLGH